MSSKLSKTNPYLRDPAMRKRLILKSVQTSSAVEGIHAPFRKLRLPPDEPGTKKKP